ncbi:MAG: hypothetical protein JOZ72_15445 [Alphaproteobacteria bacterium]|nr:hypothetical protein [Alphaproteobacteria bacterium]
MAESLPFDVPEELKRSDRGAYLEQRVFVVSPFGTQATAVLIFAALFGSYLALAGANGVALFQPLTRLALILSVMMTVIVWVQRFVRIRARRDLALMARVLKGGMEQAAEIYRLTPHGTRLVPASLLGLLIGIGFDWLLYFSGRAQIAAPLGVKLWFAAITLVMVLTFVRGVELTRMGAKATVAIIDDGLIIDLLRIEELSVWGRNSARFALIWFVISAATCLLFVSSEITIFTVALLIGCVAMGIAAFMGLMLRIHHRIVAVKAAELERIRRDIDALSGHCGADADAAQRIQGLLAYEKRIGEAGEWPFDQTTVMRVAASAGILTVPWFGQALAAFIVEKLGAS